MAAITIVFHGEGRVGKTRLAGLLLPVLKSSARSLGVTIDVLTTQREPEHGGAAARGFNLEYAINTHGEVEK